MDSVWLVAHPEDPGSETFGFDRSLGVVRGDMPPLDENWLTQDEPYGLSRRSR